MRGPGLTADARPLTGCRPGGSGNPELRSSAVSESGAAKLSCGLARTAIRGPEPGLYTAVCRQVGLPGACGRVPGRLARGLAVKARRRAQLAELQPACQWSCPAP